MNSASSITIDVADPRDLPWIADLQREHYGPMRAVAPLRLEQWYAANPNAFLVLRDGLERLGHITLLPLRPDALRALIDGEKGENAIEGSDLFGPHERSEVRGVYIESIIIPRLDLFGELVRTFDLHVARIADPNLVEALYVHPLTDAGRLLASNLRFEPLSADRASILRVDSATLVRRTAVLRKAMGRRC